LDGQGTFNYPDGKKYEGQFREGYFHGYGALTLPTGQKQEGQFRKGEFVG